MITVFPHIVKFYDYIKYQSLDWWFFYEDLIQSVRCDVGLVDVVKFDCCFNMSMCNSSNSLCVLRTKSL